MINGWCRRRRRAARRSGHKRDSHHARHRCWSPRGSSRLPSRERGQAVMRPSPLPLAWATALFCKGAGWGRAANHRMCLTSGPDRQVAGRPARSDARQRAGHGAESFQPRQSSVIVRRPAVTLRSFPLCHQTEERAMRLQTPALQYVSLGVLLWRSAAPVRPRAGAPDRVTCCRRC